MGDWAVLCSAVGDGDGGRDGGSACESRADAEEKREQAAKAYRVGRKQCGIPQVFLAG